VSVLSWGVAAVVVLGLLPGRLAAEPKPAAKAAAKAVAHPGEELMNVETTSGRFKITVDRVRRDSDHTVSIVPSGMPLMGGKGEQHEETETFPGGQRRTSTAKMGGGSGGAFAIPNLILDVGVKGPKTGKKQQLICEVNGKVHAVDDLGHDADSADLPSWLRLQLTGFDYRQGPGRTAIHLSLPPSDPEPRYLKSVEGQLLVAEGTVTQVTFQGKDLSRRTSKRAGGVSARLDKISESSDGIDITLAVSAPANTQHENVNPMANPMESLQKMMFANAPGRISVAMVDSDGKTHSAGGNPKKMAGPNGMVFYGGGGGNGGGNTSWSKGGPGGNQSGKSSSAKSNPPQDYHFDVLPAGVTVKAITCTVTDIAGTPKTVPFKFENIRLPESR